MITRRLYKVDKPVAKTQYEVPRRRRHGQQRGAQAASKARRSGCISNSILVFTELEQLNREGGCDTALHVRVRRPNSHELGKA